MRIFDLENPEKGLFFTLCNMPVITPSENKETTRNTIGDL